jgi:hypothetical protein
MNRYFHLYPEDDTQQRLRLSMSLTDIHYEAGFADVIEPFGVEVTEPEERLVSQSWQELVVRPPIPSELVQQFGEAIVGFAYSKGREGTGEIGFIDHTGDEDTAFWPDRPGSRKAKLSRVK